jgi:hypothetical protein
MQVSLTLTDFTTLLDAAQFGATRAEGFKAPQTVRAWTETVGRLQQMPLDDGRSQEQRDAAYLADFAMQCAIHGAD